MAKYCKLPNLSEIMQNHHTFTMHGLTHEWFSCLELVVDGIIAGSLGISAIVTTSDGEVISRGRNQLFDNHSSVNVVRMSSVAHAEINALANLPHQYQRDKSLRLYTTVEPCPMCLGAIAMSTIRHVYIGSRDNWASCTDLLTTHAYLKRKNIQMYFPQNSHIERLFLTLHAYSVIKNTNIDLEHNIFKTWRMVSNTAIENAILLTADTHFPTLIQDGEKEQAMVWIADVIQQNT